MGLLLGMLGATMNRLVCGNRRINARCCPATTSSPTGCGWCGRPGIGNKIVGHVLFAFPSANVLIAADLGEDLHATEHGRGLIDQGSRAIEGIRHDTVHPDVGMLGLERRQQAQGELLCGGMRSIGRRFRRPLFWGTPCFLSPLACLCHALSSGAG